MTPTPSNGTADGASPPQGAPQDNPPPFSLPEVLRDGFRIDAALDLQDAILLRSQLLQVLDVLPGEHRVTVDLSSWLATAPALQIAVALRTSLEKRGQFAGYGPAATRALCPPTAAEERG